ncbi:MAG: hypothetical protein A2W93_06850 [Bacteroidetes bacterium GWF2_43_63]|nr:MAG: hypothetical protein A2W94_07685 [Bacteroidetes bacterium GWE2_42_42]OFY53337.1 MAG: hypothetical protein A2W93_06850 [Bacteroidetes bacterium GWF2_43_63]HBG71667.1 hypothetical protein [Bacteroidales bacterium]HCB61668.1 hypothetical protein [Bacteroidales bacterium]HCY22880.1 hypothetical protein [Bacteroidales bacterium]
MSINRNSVTVEFFHLIWVVLITLAGVLLFYYSDRDEQMNYLKLNICVLNSGEDQKIRTELSNPTKYDRDIDCAFIVITECNVDLLEAINTNLNKSFKYTNYLNELKHQDLYYDDTFAFIPLNYYTDENVNIADEQLIFEIPIKRSYDNNPENVKYFYARFFVYRDKRDLKAYHRSVGATFIHQGILDFSHIKQPVCKKSKI